MSLFVEHNSEPQHIQALVDCKLHVPHLVVVFEQALESVKDSLVTAEPDRVQQLQGQAIVLRDFITAVDDSQDTKARMENS